MSFCVKCGTKIDDGILECPNCGTRVQASPEAVKSSFADKLKGLNNTADSTGKCDEKDINDNKGIAILSYFGPLVLVPLLARKDSKYARFHANQGLLVFITNIAYAIIHSILMAVLRAIFPWNWSYGIFGGRGFVYNALSTVLNLAWILITVLAIIGIVNAVSGKAKELPIIGKFRIIK